MRLHDLTKLFLSQQITWRRKDHSVFNQNKNAEGKDEDEKQADRFAGNYIPKFDLMVRFLPYGSRNLVS